MKRKTLEKRLKLCREIKKARGGSVVLYYLDAAYCSAVHGASPENYYVLRFFEKSNAERRKFLTSGRSKECDRELNRNASTGEKKNLGSKHCFDRCFADFVKRDFLYAPEAGMDEMTAFLKDHGEFMLKPDGGTMGQGIKKIRTAEIADMKAFYEACVRDRLLLESVIVQHPALEAVSPGCVCTVRINTVRGKLLGGCLKCGQAGSVTDNFHSGGIAYPLNLETGEISGPGRENTTLNDYTVHPGTDIVMPGLKVPFMDEIRTMLESACALVPGIDYIGWDIAITAEGPELIEGNFSWPGGNIIQFDDIGKYPLIRKYMETET